MTIASQVKQCLATLKSAQSGFQTLALTSQDEKAKKEFHQSMLMMDEVIADMKKRVGELEYEEPQYKGF